MLTINANKTHRMNKGNLKQLHFVHTIATKHENNTIASHVVMYKSKVYACTCKGSIPYSLPADGYKRNSNPN
jgi:hypothetical protein